MIEHAPFAAKFGSIECDLGQQTPVFQPIWLGEALKFGSSCAAKLLEFDIVYHFAACDGGWESAWESCDGDVSPRLRLRLWLPLRVFARTGDCALAPPPHGYALAICEALGMSGERLRPPTDSGMEGVATATGGVAVNVSASALVSLATASPS